MRGGRQVRKARRALKKSSLEAGTYMSSYDKYDKAVKEKAFKKDWSTRKRVKAGDRLGVKLHMDTPAVYHGGKKKDSPSSVTQSDIGKDISNMTDQQKQHTLHQYQEYQNVHVLRHQKKKHQMNSRFHAEEEEDLYLRQGVNLGIQKEEVG